MPLRSNFTMGKVVNAAEGFGKVFSEVASIRTKIEENAAKKAAQDAENVYRSSVLANQRETIANAQANVQYGRDLEEGAALQGLMALDREKAGTKTVNGYDPENAKRMYKEYQKELDFTAPSGTQELEDYDAYLKKNDPDYSKQQSPLGKGLETAKEVILDKNGNPSTLVAPYIISGIMGGYNWLTGSTSTEQEMKKKIANSPAKKDNSSAKDNKSPMTFKEFKDATYVTKEDNAHAEKAIKNWLKTEEAGKLGSFTEKQVDTLDKIPKKDLLKQLDAQVADYKKENPKASKATLIGMLKNGTKRIEKITDTRATAAIADTKRFNEIADMEMKENFAFALKKYEIDEKKKPTELEKAKIRKLLLESDILKKQHDDAQSFW